MVSQVTKERLVHLEIQDHPVYREIEVLGVLTARKVRKVKGVIVVLMVNGVSPVLLPVPQDFMLQDTVKAKIHHHVHSATRNCGMVTVCYMFKVLYYPDNLQ